MTDHAVTEASYADTGLSSETRYAYRVHSVDAAGDEAVSNTATIETRAPAPACDPYYNDNVTHVSNGRAHNFLGLTFARGSWDFMGLWSLLSETALYRDEEGYQVGVCP